MLIILQFPQLVSRLLFSVKEGLITGRTDHPRTGLTGTNEKGEFPCNLQYCSDVLFPVITRQGTIVKFILPRSITSCRELIRMIS